MLFSRRRGNTGIGYTLETLLGLEENNLISSAIDKIRSVDEKRASEVSAFYIDLGCSIGSIAQVLSPRATICYVVGNRQVKGVMLPTDEFVVDAPSSAWVCTQEYHCQKRTKQTDAEEEQPLQHCR